MAHIFSISLCFCVSASEKMDTTGTQVKRKAFRFAAAQDIILLKEVVCQHPFAAQQPGKVWVNIAQRLQDLGLQVDARRCRERTILLVDYFRKEDQEMLKRYVIM